MTLLDFAAAHTVAAIILAGLALAASALLFALPVTLVSLVTSWRASRGMSAADRAALNQAAALLRSFARHYDPGTIGSIDRVDAAEKLERMAAQ